MMQGSAGVAAVLVLLGIAAPPARGGGEDLVPGLVGEYFQLSGPLERFPEIPPDRKPDLQRVDRRIRFEAGGEGFAGTRFQDYFFARWTGLLRAPRKGKYLFYLCSDDGSRLFVDGKLVVDNGGLHAMQEEDGSIELSPGDHPLRIDFFNNTGPAGCIASWRPPAGEKEEIPEGVLFHPRERTPAAAPPAPAPAAGKAGPEPNRVSPLPPAAGERPPDLSGRVEGVFQDDPLALLVIKKGSREIPVYTDQGTRVAYVGILREGRRPTVGYTAHVWLRPGAPDTAEAVRFTLERR